MNPCDHVTLLTSPLCTCTEIADMKEQIKEMDGELERYHKTNSGLDLMIANLKLKVSGAVVLKGALKVSSA
eukprot:354174-Chlamydomonas_euryale.AAC.2